MHKFQIDNTDVWQPDSGLSISFETTYTPGSTRTQIGTGMFTPLYTVESYGYRATGIPAYEVSKILQLIVAKSYKLHYFSAYYGVWRDDVFYTGKGSLSLGQLDEETGTYDSLSFNMIGVNPIDPSQ